MSKNYWVSWYHKSGIGEFELHSPWWVSGERGSDYAATICAAIKANDEDDAIETVYNSYDKRPDYIEFRFTNERAGDWSPFGGRFPKANWMVWIV